MVVARSSTPYRVTIPRNLLSNTGYPDNLMEDSDLDYFVEASNLVWREDWSIPMNPDHWYDIAFRDRKVAQRFCLILGCRDDENPSS